MLLTFVNRFFGILPDQQPITLSFSRLQAYKRQRTLRSLVSDSSTLSVFLSSRSPLLSATLKQSDDKNQLQCLILVRGDQVGSDSV